MERDDLDSDDPVPGGSHDRRVEGNRILAALPDAEREALTAVAQPVTASKGELLVTPGTFGGYAYFPTSGLLALQIANRDGAAATIEITGREGMIGLWAHLDASPAPYLGVALLPLAASRVDVRSLRRVARPGSALARLLERYAELLLRQRAILLGCHRAHHLRERLARFLTTCVRRAGTAALEITHEDIAQGVGAHRPAVTDALHALVSDGAIQIGRGRIEVADPARLRAGACECAELIERLHRDFPG